MTDNASRQLTEEEQIDLQKRVEGFNADMIPLLKKWELGLGASAFLLPDGRIAARPQLFDDRRPAEPAPKEGEAPAPEKQPEGGLESSAS